MTWLHAIAYATYRLIARPETPMADAVVEQVKQSEWYKARQEKKEIEKLIRKRLLKELKEEE